jgi:toxin ParE1/3/4
VKPVVVEEGAELEFEEAAERYEATDPAMAARFVENVLMVIDSVQRSPREWPLALTVPDRYGVRRRLVPDFPYSVVYKELAGVVWVVAIAHGKRRPGYWGKRMRQPPP